MKTLEQPLERQELMKEVTFDVPSPDGHGRKGHLTLTLDRVGMAGATLKVDVCMDAEIPRPAYWEKLKQMLKSRQFDLEGGLGLEDDELFLPTTFFSADVAIRATRGYAPGQEPETTGDVQAILDCLQDRTPRMARRSVRRHNHG